MKKIIETEDGCLWIENEAKHFIEGIFFHWDIYVWSHTKVRYYRELWHNIICPKLLVFYKEIYAIPPTEKEEKLIKMFGFEDTGLRFQGNKLLIYASKTHQNALQEAQNIFEGDR